MRSTGMISYLRKGIISDHLPPEELENKNAFCRYSVCSAFCAHCQEDPMQCFFFPMHVQNMT